MCDPFDRERKLIGIQGFEKLKKAHVAIFGIGGVGSYCAEALARASVGTLTLIDHDTVDITNLNRQLHALHSTVGQSKVEVMARRIKDINPGAVVHAVPAFFTTENANEIMNPAWDYIADAIDTVSSKIELVVRAQGQSIPIISSMGTGNKMNPEQFEVADLYQTSVCPLCRVMRRELKVRGIQRLTVVYSKEVPKRPDGDDPRTPASISFAPPVAGLIMAAHIVKGLLSD